MGGFMDKDYNLWRYPRWKLCVFFSSPFDDTANERNALLDRVLFKLREDFNDVEVVFTDLRFGLKDIISNDHNTWNACAKEIENCFASSLGMFFVSLQSNTRYGRGFRSFFIVHRSNIIAGFTPLPKFITFHKFNELCNISPECKAVAEKWYIEDTNCFPEALYTLKRLRDDSDYDWQRLTAECFPTLFQHLVNYPADLTREDVLKVGQSVTEWELRHALHLARNDIQRMHWIDRSVDISTVANAICTNKSEMLKRFFDRQDPSSSSIRENSECKRIRGFMESIFSRDKRSKFEGISFQTLVAEESDPTAKSEQDDYLKDWTDCLAKLLTDELLKVRLQRDSWKEMERELDLPEYVLQDFFHHYEWAYSRCHLFIGRDSIITRLTNQVMLDPYPFNPRKPFSGVSLCVVGDQGTGKTSVLAKAASEIHRVDPMKRPLIMRFCGTNSKSFRALDLVQSICFQIQHACMGITENFACYNDYYDAVEYFHELLSKFPILLFIDGLNQLSNHNMGRSNLSFLKNVRPHRDGRIVVSTLPDTKQAFFGCLSRMNESAVPKFTVPLFRLAANDDDTIHSFVEALLLQRGRRVTSAQLDVISVAAAQEPSALYLFLAVLVAEHWRSTTVAVPGDFFSSVVPTTEGLMFHLLESVESEFGSKFTSTTLGLLSYAVEGLTDSEIVDLVSLAMHADSELKNEVHAYWTVFGPNVKRCPLHMWLRLKNFLSRLFSESVHCCTVW
jgi:hypothetical protein